MKGQSAVEFIMIFAVIMAFVVAILLNGFKQDEQVMAVAAARIAGVECANEKGLILGQLEDSIDYDASTFTIDAKFYDQKGNVPVIRATADECRQRMVQAIQKTLGQHLTPESAGSTYAQGGQYKYYVS